MTVLKIIIPMAGIGKRLFPLTQHRPKPLVRLANGRLLDHVLNTFKELEEIHTLEYVFIIGYLGEQIKEHMKEAHPDKTVTYYVQDQLIGQSHAVYLAKESISGPILLTYGDTINQADYSFLSRETLDGVASVKEVEDPRRHGVAILGSDNLITSLIEKPASMEHKLALTGLYYFSEGEKLIEAIEAQMRNGSALNNEYYLADAINILIENGMRIRTERILQWLDAGTPEALIETNAQLIQYHGEAVREMRGARSNVFIDPVYVHESSRIEGSIIGPNVSIGRNCGINGSMIKNSIIDDNSIITETSLAASLIGQSCSISGHPLQSVVADFDHLRIHHPVDDQAGPNRP